MEKFLFKVHCYRVFFSSFAVIFLHLEVHHCYFNALRVYIEKIEEKKKIIDLVRQNIYFNFLSIKPFCKAGFKGEFHLSAGRDFTESWLTISLSRKGIMTS